jgi:hypothetical protein
MTETSSSSNTPLHALSAMTLRGLIARRERSPAERMQATLARADAVQSRLAGRFEQDLPLLQAATQFMAAHTPGRPLTLIAD